MTAAEHMLMFTVFMLSGIGLCIRKHWIWGVLCFVVALAAMFFMF
jgi:hypothetical protein